MSISQPYNANIRPMRIEVTDQNHGSRFTNMKRSPEKIHLSRQRCDAFDAMEVDIDKRIVPSSGTDSLDKYDPMEVDRKEQSKLLTPPSLSNLEQRIKDIDNKQLGGGSEYADRIYKSNKRAEMKLSPGNYMCCTNCPFDIDLIITFRDKFACWMLKEYHKRKHCNLRRETIFLAMATADRYLTMHHVSPSEVPLVCVSALLLASKIEQGYAWKVREFIFAKSSLDRDDIVAGEKEILKKLKWDIDVPTCYSFLGRFLKISNEGNETMQLQEMVYRIAEVTLSDYCTVRKFPSEVAAGIIYASRMELQILPFWNDLMVHYTGYAEGELSTYAGTLLMLGRQSGLLAARRDETTARFQGRKGSSFARKN